MFVAYSYVKCKKKQKNLINTIRVGYAVQNRQLTTKNLPANNLCAMIKAWAGVIFFCGRRLAMPVQL
jgi:hypothetical protein